MQNGKLTESAEAGSSLKPFVCRCCAILNPIETVLDAVLNGVDCDQPVVSRIFDPKSDACGSTPSINKVVST